MDSIKKTQLQRHHPAELADLLIVQRIPKDLPYLVRKSLLRDMRKRRAIQLYILHMNVDPTRIFRPSLTNIC